MRLTAIGVAACLGALVACSSSTEPAELNTSSDTPEATSESEPEPPEIYVSDEPQGEQALGRFILKLDTEENCIYLGSTGGTSRTLPLWPPAYTIEDDPIRVVGPSGQRTLALDQTFEASGGDRSIEFLPGGNKCGAEGVFMLGEIVVDRPEFLLD